MERLKKKAGSLVLFFFVFTAIYIMLPDFQKIQQTAGLPLAGAVVAIDAGHGGVDGGAVSQDGIVEKDIALKVSAKVRDYLQQAGAVVVMTREGDYDLADEETKGYSRRKTQDLHKRVEVVNDSDAQLLVSIHLNSIPSSKWSGAQCFYALGSVEGERLANKIQEQLASFTEKTDRVPLPDKRIFLLKSVDMPAVTVEVGFLSNPEEARLMTTEDYQQKLAHSIYLGIAQYITEASASETE